MSPLRELVYYPTDYAQARGSFLAQASRLREQGLAVEVDSFRVPSTRDPDLFVDHLYLPPISPDPELLLVLVSGVHGMEGYTGSAVQKMFIEEVLPTMNRQRTGVWLVHALNPFGFKYHRRSTEANVNLNRNFATGPELFATRNEGYNRIARFFEPSAKAGAPAKGFLEVAAFIARQLVSGRLTGGELTVAIARGQYEHPRGMEYGGRGLEPQTEHFISALRGRMAPFKDIVLFDLHTGLGDKYQLHLIAVDDPKSRDPELLGRLFEVERDRDVCVMTPTDAEGFYPTDGDLNTLIPALARADQRTLALTWEFGTLGGGSWAKMESLNRLRLENQGYNNGYLNPWMERMVRRRFEELFFPTDPRWRVNAIQRARTLLKRIALRLEPAV